MLVTVPERVVVSHNWQCATQRCARRARRLARLLSVNLDSRHRRFNHLFLGGEVDLVGVVSTISGLLTRTGT